MAPGIFDRIVVPTDFSDCAEAAWALAKRIAVATRSEIVLVHVFIESPYGDLLPGAGPAWEGIERAHTWVEQELDKWASAARSEGIPVRAVARTGEPYRGIVDLATDERADLVVIGTHGRSGMSRILLGSVADRVIRLAPCPVLTVRTPE